MGTWYGMHWIRDDKRKAIHDRDGNVCAYCGSPDRLTLDHLKPRAKNGHNGATNLITACKSCNQRKGDRSWREFAGDESIIQQINRLKRRSIVTRRKEAKLELLNAA